MLTAMLQSNGTIDMVPLSSVCCQFTQLCVCLFVMGVLWISVESQGTTFCTDNEPCVEFFCVRNFRDAMQGKHFQI